MNTRRRFVCKMRRLLDRTHRGKLAHYQNTLLLVTLHACVRNIWGKAKMFGSLEVSLGLKVLAITAAAARRFGLWTCAVFSWAFWNFPEFSRSCDRRWPSKLCPASGTWMTCLIRTLSSRTRMRSLHSIDSDRQLCHRSIEKQICNTWCAVVEASSWANVNNVSSSLLTRILGRH